MAKKEKTPQEQFAEDFVKQMKPETVQDVESGLKSIFGPIFEAMLQGELEAHLGYESNNHNPKETDNRRNGYTQKPLVSTAGEIPIKAPRDRDGSFDPKAVPKRKRDISGIQDKVLAMYAKGLSQRDIADIIKDIYGFELSAQQISLITDSVIEAMKEWQNRALKKMYSFMFVDCLYVSIRTEFEVTKHAVYCIVSYDLDGRKDILGLWIDNTENKSQWLLILDELKTRGVEDVAFISMDGLSGLEEAVNTIFPKATVQRCTVHLIRNSIKYISAKQYKAFTSDLKTIYQSTNKKQALLAFERFK